MQLFLSYASEDRQIAEQIQLALIGAGHHAFFDRESLPPGGDYHARIERAVQESDVFLFLISPDSVVQGSFALTELKYARTKWPHPKDKVVPVIVRPTAWDTIPNYLKAVTVLEPEGSVAAEVVTAVAALERRPSRHRRYMIVALIGLLGVLGAALIEYRDKIFVQSQLPPAVAALLPAPQPKSPECGSTIPRPPDDGLLLSWTRVDGASTYTVEVDCFGCFGKRDWHSFGGSSWHLRTGLGLRSPIYSSNEIHAALRDAGGVAIRWRVWAVGHDGVKGENSAWCQLAFAG